MENQKIIQYDGKTFRASKTNPKYYYADVQIEKKRKKIALHRYIYSQKYGEIESGFDIHHIDGDCFNNDINNLSKIERSIHRSEHQTQRMQNPEYRANAIKKLRDSDLKAREWHSSEEGRLWHSINSKNAWKNKVLHTKNCKFCKKDFETPFPTRAIYCSNICNQRNRAFIKKTEITNNLVNK